MHTADVIHAHVPEIVKKLPASDWLGYRYAINKLSGVWLIINYKVIASAGEPGVARRLGESCYSG